VAKHLEIISRTLPVRAPEQALVQGQEQALVLVQELVSVLELELLLGLEQAPVLVLGPVQEPEQVLTHMPPE